MDDERNQLRELLRECRSRMIPGDCPGLCHVARARGRTAPRRPAEATDSNVIRFPLGLGGARKKGARIADPRGARPRHPVAAVLALSVIVGAAAWAPGRALVLRLAARTPPVRLALPTVATAAPQIGLAKYRRAECTSAIPGERIHAIDRLDPCSLTIGEGGYQAL